MDAITAEDTLQRLNDCISKSQSRTELWREFIRGAQVQRMAEVGVYTGDFAANMLKSCETVSKYYMVDPWRHLSDWNKPANQNDPTFERIFENAKSQTDFAAARRVILRGKTTEVIDQIPDGELDFAYIDGDHTLKGIVIDMIRVYPKVRAGGFLGGDDFSPGIWQHRWKFEPTLVFPFAVNFAEAVGAVIYALPYQQFCLEKNDGGQFKFVDLTGAYAQTDLRSQMTPRRLMRLTAREGFHIAKKILTLGSSK
jgi:hypothetical protein